MADPASPTRSADKSRSARFQFFTSLSSKANWIPKSPTSLGWFALESMVRPAGKQTSKHSRKPSALRSTIRPSSFGSTECAPVTSGKSRRTAVCGPTWPVSLSAALVPKRTRSNGASFLIAAARALEVASVSAPARAGSQSKTPRSTPMAMASFRVKAHGSGPMERAVIVPPSSSLMRNATSKTGRS